MGYCYPSTVIESGMKALLQSESYLTFKLHRLHVIEELNCHCVFQYFRDRLPCLIMHFSLIEQKKKWILLLLTPDFLFLCFGSIVIHAGMSRTPRRPGWWRRFFIWCIWKYSLLCFWLWRRHLYVLISKIATKFCDAFFFSFKYIYRVFSSLQVWHNEGESSLQSST